MILSLFSRQSASYTYVATRGVWTAPRIVPVSAAEWRLPLACTLYWYPARGTAELATVVCISTANRLFSSYPYDDVTPFGRTTFSRLPTPSYRYSVVC